MRNRTIYGHCIGVSTTLALLINAAYWVLLLGNSDLLARISASFSQSSMAMYLVSIVLFFLSFVIIHPIVTHFSSKSCAKITALYDKSGKLGFVLFAAILVVYTVLLCLMFAGATKQLGHMFPAMHFWRHIPFWILFIVLLFSFAAFYLSSNSLDNFSTEKSQRGDRAFFVLTAALVLVAGYVKYYPNFYTVSADLHHINAYYNSIFNVYHGTPYSLSSYSIYGHYGLFFGGIMRFFDLFQITNAYNIYTYTAAFLAALQYFFAVYALHVFVKNRSIKLLGCLAMLFFQATLVQSMQQFHRTFLVCTMLGLFAFAVQHKTRVRLIAVLGYVVTCLLVLWSTEFGLVCVLAWTSFLIVLALQKYRLLSTQLWLRVVIYMLAAGLCVLGAFAIINLYNVLVGGSTVPFAYLFRTVANSWYIDLHRQPLPTWVSAWMFLLPMLFAVAAVGLAKTKLFNRETEPDISGGAIFGIAVLGLGTLMYYMNRAAWTNNWPNVMLYVLLMGIIAQKCLPSMHHFTAGLRKKSVLWWRGPVSAIGLVSVFLLFSMALGSVAGTGNAIMRDQALRDKVMLHEGARQISENIPANTPALGRSTTLYYSVLGWDTHNYLVDAASFMLEESGRQAWTDVFMGLDGKPFVTDAHTLEQLRRYLPEVHDHFLATHRLQWTLVNLDIIPGLDEWDTELCQYYVPI